MHSACGKLCGKLHGHREQLQSLQHRQVVVTAMSSESIDDGDGGKVVEYVFRCYAIVGNDRPIWEVRRRESDFQKLHLHLKKKGHVLAEYPTQNFFSKIGAGFLSKRKEDSFKEYLNSMLNHCSDEQCVLLCKFLRVNKQVQLCKVHPDENESLAPHSAPRNRDVSIPEVSEHTGQSRKYNSGKVTLASVPFSSLQKIETPHSTHGVDSELLVVPYSSSDDDSQYEKACSKRRGSNAPKPELAKARNAASESECVFCNTEAEPPSRQPYTVTASHRSSSHLSKTEVLKQQKALLDDLKLRQQVQPHTSNAGGHSSENADSLDTSPNHIQAESVASSDSKSAGVAGIGLVFVFVDHGLNKGMVSVDEVMEGSPAEADGTISVGDLLLSVNGVSVAAKDLTRIRSMIIGGVGTQVTLEIERADPWLDKARRFFVTLRRGQSCGRVEKGPALPLVCAGAKGAPPQVHYSAQLLEDSSQCETVRAAFAFTAVRGHELNLQPGDRIAVLRKHDSGWWEGKAVGSGLTGWFPSNHVQVVSGSSSGSNSPLSESDTLGSKPLSAESSCSAKSLSLRSTVHGNLSANSCDSAASAPSPKEAERKVDEVCTWLKTVDLKDAVEVKRGSHQDRSSFGISSLVMR